MPAMQLIIYREDLLKHTQQLPLRMIEVKHVHPDILKRLRNNMTLILQVNDKDVLNNGVCSKTLRQPLRPDPYIIMTKEDYDYDKQIADDIIYRDVFYMLHHLNGIPRNIVIEYLVNVKKQETWNPV